MGERKANQKRNGGMECVCLKQTIRQLTNYRSFKKLRCVVLVVIIIITFERKSVASSALINFKDNHCLNAGGMKRYTYRYRVEKRPLENRKKDQPQQQRAPQDAARKTQNRPS